MMNKQTGTIITIVIAVLTLCCSATCCLGGVLVALNEEINLYWGIEPAWGIAPCCLSILVWVAPLLLWLFLVRGKNGDSGNDLGLGSYAPPEEYIEGDFEEGTLV
jgi:hypothetical protein